MGKATAAPPTGSVHQQMQMVQNGALKNLLPVHYAKIPQASCKTQTASILINCVLCKLYVKGIETKPLYSHPKYSFGIGI